MSSMTRVIMVSGWESKMANTYEWVGVGLLRASKRVRVCVCVCRVGGRVYEGGRGRDAERAAERSTS